MKANRKRTAGFSNVDPVRVGNAGDGEDVCSQEETSWYHGEFIHVGGHRWWVRGRRDMKESPKPTCRAHQSGIWGVPHPLCNLRRWDVHAQVIS